MIRNSFVSIEEVCKCNIISQKTGIWNRMHLYFKKHISKVRLHIITQKLTKQQENLQVRQRDAYKSLAFFIQRARRKRLDCFLKWNELSCIVAVLSTRSSILSPLSIIFSMFSTITDRICKQHKQWEKNNLYMWNNVKNFGQLKGSAFSIWTTQRNNF